MSQGSRPTEGVKVLYARQEDVDRLTEIHNHYVKETYATFDDEPRDRTVALKLFARYRTTGPYRLWVACLDDVVVGFASSNPYREHPAFRQTIETSIYLAPGVRGRGIGTALYSELFSALRGEPLHRAVVGIALPNPDSIALHEKFGFRKVGVFHEYANKAGRRISSVWMEKALDGAW